MANEATLETYRSQLNQTLAALTENPDDVDLQDVAVSLSELIELMEADPGPANVSEGSLMQIESSAEPEGSDNALSEESDVSTVLQDNLVASLLHMQCRVPFQHSWGQKTYCSALVQSVESFPSTDEEDDEVRVRVLFLHPTHRSMVTCKYFLGGRCRFAPEQCHFSHGEVYRLSELEPYVPPDFSDLKPGSRVLCSGADDIWKRGTVREMPTDSSADTLKVQFDGAPSPTDIDLQSIVPVDGLNEESVEENENRNDTEAGDGVDDAEFAPHSAWQQDVGQVSGEFGRWETYNRGVASKLMAKMGYVVGQSLGSRSGGMVEPIIAQVFPKGRTLDYCMELRDQKDFAKVGQENNRKTRGMTSRNIKNSSAVERTPKQDVFSVINTQMNAHRKKFFANTTDQSTHQPAKTKPTPSSAKEQNVELIKLEDKISSLEKELTRLRGSLARNQSSDKAATLVIKEKIAVKEDELGVLRRKQNSIVQDLNKQKDKKSMTVF